MAYAFALPDNIKEAEFTIDRMITSGKQHRNPQAVSWWIAHWYLRGARYFTNLNYNDGSVKVGFTDQSGTLKFQYEGIVSQYIGQLGRLLAIDLSPVVSRKGISLDGLRKSGVAQTVLSAAFPTQKVEALKMDLFSTLLMYGTAGVGLWVESEDSMGLEVMMPWELIPIPTSVSSAGGVRGLIRRRFVPLEWVKNLEATTGKKSKKYGEMETYRVQRGEIPTEVYNRFQGDITSLSRGEGGTYIQDKSLQKDYIGSGGTKSKDDTYMDLVELAEAWTYTPDNYLDEYIIQAGGRLVSRDKITAKRHPPIAVARDTTVGGFWGRSFVDLLIPLNTEAEYAIGSTMQAVNEFDLYGVTFWPTSSGVPADAQRAADGRKIVQYEVDYTVPEQKPFNFQPARMTPVHTKAIELAVQLNDKIASQPQALMQGDAPGRVDSSQGLGLLYEISSVPLAPVAKSSAAAVSQCYRAALGIARDNWPAEKVVDISSLDDNVAGIKFDPDRGTMALADNAIPHPDEVIVTVSSAVPQSPEQKKAELKDALATQTISMREYQFKVREEGLDLPVGDDAAWENHRRAVMENISLFGDGATPGQITPSDRDMHDVHLEDLDVFMAKPEFHLASPQVRNAFVEHREFHTTGLGNLPEGMENIEEAAELALMQGDMTQMAPPPMQ
jgi:hypothetical protein